MQVLLLRRSFALLTQGNLKSRRCCVVNVIEVQSTSYLSRFVVCLASQWVTLWSSRKSDAVIECETCEGRSEICRGLWVKFYVCGCAVFRGISEPCDI
jgi:hypothetical protein